MKGEHHLAIPNHNPLKVGTLNAIMSRVAEHFQLSKEQAETADVPGNRFECITTFVANQ